MILKLPERMSSSDADNAGWYNLKRVIVEGKNSNGGPKTKNFGTRLSSFTCKIKKPGKKEGAADAGAARG
ncbi:hypothetical protein IAQ61_004803 [Plenodomus lingam]|uniref:uncharacterized protein n=1 Tax=Leptosphaeria maculans TaxID=5022 RepID=UPI00331789C8|nr:hypothetical protein IAQ61_004803 [Plenodomus lingam]